MSALLTHPWMAAAVGGALAAAASTINLLFNGEITGFSGLLNGVVCCKPFPYYRLSLLSSLVATGSLVYATAPKFFSLDSAPPLTSAAYLLAGFLVGFGAVCGNGCTSGHGICGLPRLSKRSFAAVMTFMATGVLSATLLYNLPPSLHDFFFVPHGLEHSSPSFFVIANAKQIVAGTALAVLVYALFKQNQVDQQDKINKPALSTVVVAGVVGAVFGLGMIVSGMVNQSKVQQFLNPIHPAGWDPSLMFVMALGVMTNFFSFQWVTSRSRPILKAKFEIPSRSDITPRLLIGSAIFGVGWGLGGICPAPGLVSLAAGRLSSLLWLVGAVSGMFVFSKVETCFGK